MKKIILKKASGLFALLLAVSMMVQAFAMAESFSGGFKDVVFHNDGTVTGQVYFNGLVKSSVNDAVYVDVTNGASYNDVITATYSTYNPSTGIYYYDFNNFTVTDSTYDYITLTTQDASPSVTKTVYRDKPTTYYGGGFYTPNTTVGTDGNISESTLASLLQGNADVTLTLQGDFVLLPASALTEGNSLKLVSSKATYTLPLSVLHLEDLAKELGLTDLSGLVIKVSMAEVTGDTAAAISSAASALGGTAIDPAIDFNIVLMDQNDQVLKTFDTFDSYVTRTITLDQLTDGSQATGVVYDPETGEFSFVPSTFSDLNGKTIATIQRNSNSIYTVLEVNKSFDDIAGTWAQSTIQLLANKLVIYGETDTTFAPQKNITRAEFASLISEALGLKEDASAAAKFSDVPSSFWGAGVIGAVSKAGIIYGDGDGTYRPNDYITREELASLMSEALKFVGTSEALTPAEQTAALAKFTDSASITWGSADVAALVDAEIIKGYPDNTYQPASQATRAESAEMLKLLLQYINFIN